MIFYYFYCRNLGLVMTNLGAYVCIVLLVFAAALLDLFLGVRESKKSGDFIHSYGLRRTIEKLTIYLSLVTIGFIVDAINPIFFYWKIDHLPVTTILLSLGLIYAEYISIREHLSEGARKKIRSLPKDLKNVVSELSELKEEISNLKK